MEGRGHNDVRASQSPLTAVQKPEWRRLLGLLQMPEREVFEYARQFVEMLRATEPEPEPEPS